MKLFTLNKKFTLLLAVLVLGSLLGIAIAMASGDTRGDEQKATEWIAQEEERIAQQQEWMNSLLTLPGIVEGNRSFYELSWDRATNEQREQLEAIFADDGIGLMGEWRRDVLITLGDLPADTPRLTIEDAANLYSSVEYYKIENEFNNIAGAPDYRSIYLAVYFLNDERTEAIVLELYDVHHLVFNEDGTGTRLSMGTQRFSAPYPSIGPVIDNEYYIIFNPDGTRTIVYVEAQEPSPTPTPT